MGIIINIFTRIPIKQHETTSIVESKASFFFFVAHHPVLEMSTQGVRPSDVSKGQAPRDRQKSLNHLFV